MNNSQQTARVGLFFLLGLALTWVTFATLSGESIFKSKGYHLIAGFDRQSAAERQYAGILSRTY